jgi:hypothetical protein
MSDALNTLYEGLRSNLTTKRKAALKSLVTFLEQEQQADDESRGGGGGGGNATWLRRLDAETAAVPAGAALPQSTWPALLHATAKCVGVEVGLGASDDGSLRDPPRPSDVAAARALRAVVAAADSAARRPRGVPGIAAASASGGGAASLTACTVAAPPPLARRAAKLLRHVRDVLLASPISGNALSSEYASLLRSQLLPPRADAGAYLARAPAGVVRDLIAWASGAAEAAVRGKGRRTAAEDEEQEALGRGAAAPAAAAASFAAEAEQALAILALLLRCAPCDVGSEAREASFRAIARVATALNAAAAAAAEEGLADLTAGGVGGGGGGSGDGGTAANDAAAAGLAAASAALSRLEPSPLAVPTYARVHGALLQAAAALLEREGTEMTAAGSPAPAAAAGGTGAVRRLSLLCRPSAAAAWRALGPLGRSSRDKRIRAAAVAYVSALADTGQLHDDAEFVGGGGGGGSGCVAGSAAASTSSSSSSSSSSAVAQSASSLLELLAWVRGAVANEAFAGWKKAGPEGSAAVGPSTPGGRRALLRLAAAVEAAAGLSRHAPSLRAAAASSSSPSSAIASAAANAAASAEACDGEEDGEEGNEGKEEERRPPRPGGAAI